MWRFRHFLITLTKEFHNAVDPMIICFLVTWREWHLVSKGVYLWLSTVYIPVGDVIWRTGNEVGTQAITNHLAFKTQGRHFQQIINEFLFLFSLVDSRSWSRNWALQHEFQNSGLLGFALVYNRWGFEIEDQSHARYFRNIYQHKNLSCLKPFTLQTLYLDKV